MSSSSQYLNFTGTGGESFVLFSHQRRLSQDAFSQREQHVDVFGCNESIFINSNPANVAKSLRDGNRNHFAYSNKIQIDEAGAKSGIS